MKKQIKWLFYLLSSLIVFVKSFKLFSYLAFEFNYKKLFNKKHNIF